MMITMITFALKITIILVCNEVFNSECENNITLKNDFEFASLVVEKSICEI